MSAAVDHGGFPIPDHALGSAPGWPVVLRFGRVRPEGGPADCDLTPDAFGRALDEVLRDFEPADPCVLMADHHLIRGNQPSALMTFDGGYRDQVDFALPRLEERGVKALFFVRPATLGGHPPRPREDRLDWDVCRDLRGAGHVLGCHGTEPGGGHPPAPAETRAQVIRSLHDLRFHVGVRRGLYAHPRGTESPVPRHVPRLGMLLAFGAAGTPARPWTDVPLAIRRTHLPARTPDSWHHLVRGWRDQWERG